MDVAFNDTTFLVLRSHIWTVNGVHFSFITDFDHFFYFPLYIPWLTLIYFQRSLALFNSFQPLNQPKKLRKIDRFIGPQIKNCSMHGMAIRTAIQAAFTKKDAQQFIDH